MKKFFVYQYLLGKVSTSVQGYRAGYGSHVELYQYLLGKVST